HRSGEGAIEAGIQRWPVRAHSLEFLADRLFYFIHGRGTFRGGSGETIAAEPGMVVHVKSGWSGELAVIETLDASYMQCPGSAGAPLTLRDAINAAPLKDWGVIPTMIEGSSRTAGILLSRDADGRAESGLWTCTPGLWRCEVTRDEFCHFLEGRCTYTHKDGERIEIAPNTVAFFPAGWSGRCEVRQTVRKIYMIR
ncbi:MAG TPA: cupin domain-containing protein, partial [Terriglobales bacterium]|nr:cupin domain-containing protein [Terriglobales bacterium]